MAWGDQTWHKVQDLLSSEFNVDDDTYKGVAKDIHNLFLEDGWEPPRQDESVDSSEDAVVPTGRYVLKEPEVPMDTSLETYLTRFIQDRVRVMDEGIDLLTLHGTAGLRIYRWVNNYSYFTETVVDHKLPRGEIIYMPFGQKPKVTNGTDATPEGRDSPAG